jgi:hypothetical protein
MNAAPGDWQLHWQPQTRSRFELKGLSGRLRSLLDTTSVDSPESQELPITKQSLLGDSKNV